MAANRITPGAGMRRALLAAAALALALLALGGCGSDGGGEITTDVPDKESDATVLNEILSRQLGAVEAVGRTLPALRGADRELAEKLRAQEQEHVDATLKALRGIGAESEAEPEAIEASELRTREDRLRFIYEIENATIDAELNAISRLTGEWLRPLLGTMVANQAQHLVLLRQALGLPPLETLPSAFVTGEEELELPE